MNDIRLAAGYCPVSVLSVWQAQQHKFLSGISFTSGLLPRSGTSPVRIGEELQTLVLPSFCFALRRHLVVVCNIIV